MEYIAGLLALLLLPKLVKLIDKGYKEFKTTELKDDLEKFFDDPVENSVKQNS